MDTSLAQELRVITLNQNDDSFADASKIALFPGDTLQFRSINGDFSIYIEDAYKFLKIREDNLKLRLDSTDNALSDLYIVRAVDTDSEVKISLYCISTDSWPDAPPRIIIVSQ
jgi:hypothetical protein